METKIHCWLLYSSALSLTNIASINVIHTLNMDGYGMQSSDLHLYRVYWYILALSIQQVHSNPQ